MPSKQIRKRRSADGVRSSALPPERSLGHVIRETNRVFQRQLGERIAAYGVSLGQWYVLRVLWQSEGLSQVELAERAGIMTPTATVALQTMFRRGFATFRADKADRRRKLVYLTKAGKALEAKCLAQAANLNREALRGTSSKDLEICLTVLRATQRRLAPDGPL